MVKNESWDFVLGRGGLAVFVVMMCVSFCRADITFFKGDEGGFVMAGGNNICN